MGRYVSLAVEQREREMELKWLEDFIVLSETENFTQAAAKRNVTQPAFSRRIRMLETWLGVLLIERSVYPIELTEAGKSFAERAVAIKRAILTARTEIQQKYGQEEELVRFSDAPATHWDLAGLDIETQAPALFIIILFSGESFELVGGYGPADAVREFGESEFPNDPAAIIEAARLRFDVLSDKVTGNLAELKAILSL